MPRYVAFLRAINIGGRRASSQQLAECLDDRGFTNVVNFRASGNLIFDAERSSAAGLKRRVDEALAEGLGFEVRSFIRTAAQVRAIAAFEPFPPKVLAQSQGKLQVALLAKPPPKATRDEILALATAADPLAISGSELYWLPSGPTMQTDLDLRLLDKLAGDNTRRTKNMISEIAAKFLDG
ncbi:MAG: DUF1697 domain-containing protein [Solirubrobacterales bacterium]